MEVQNAETVFKATVQISFWASDLLVELFPTLSQVRFTGGVHKWGSQEASHTEPPLKQNSWFLLPSLVFPASNDISVSLAADAGKLEVIFYVSYLIILNAHILLPPSSVGSTLKHVLNWSF